MSNAPVTTDLIDTYRWRAAPPDRYDRTGREVVNQYLFGTIGYNPERRTHLLVPDIDHDRLTTACHHGNDIPWVHDHWSDEASQPDDLCSACEPIVQRLIAAEASS